MATEIAIEMIEPHPRNSNVMTEEAMKKLERHIERSGRYEPLVVRPVKEEAHALAPTSSELQSVAPLFRRLLPAG
jgi:hypothetical protein